MYSPRARFAREKRCRTLAMNEAAVSEAVVRAQALDAEGRHDDAINALATAAQRGDVQATTALAKRIIVGDRAPRLRRQGIALLADAVKQGSAEAADRLAVIRAWGVFAQPDWPAALGLLALAAERGWTFAQLQLGVLASMAGTDARPPSAPLDESGLRRLLVPAAGAVLNEEPRICVFPQFVNERVCDWLIDRARGRLERARVYDAHRRTDYVDESRTNSSAVFDIMQADLVQLMVQARMSIACGQPMNHMEASTVLHYGVGETIGNHYDFVDPSHPDYALEVRTSGNRVVTFLVYLNDDYGGGETDFPRIGVSHRGRRGEGLYFVNTHADGQPNLLTLHSGRPPTRGEKWVFSQFVRNRPEVVSD
jgi:prolyl 4-hydroxylase